MLWFMERGGMVWKESYKKEDAYGTGDGDRES